MFDKVLVATDLSDASEAVLHCAKGLIPLGAKQAVLVHAIGIPRLETMAHGMARFLEPLLAKETFVIFAYPHLSVHSKACYFGSLPERHFPFS